MVDELCPRCGWVLGASVAACPACGARLTRTGSGFETVYFPEAAAAGADGASNQPSSSTSLLHESEPTAGPQGVELKLQPLLVQRGGSQSGQRLQVSCPSTTVGRGEGEIRIDDPALSGRHFKIEECGHRFFLRDLESTNGTFLNGHLVRSAPLKSGDEIRAGESVFVFSILEVIACD